eukprot:SAG31_NODE_24000_length_491_cov_0.984694_1_plen_96_part_10
MGMRTAALLWALGKISVVVAATTLKAVTRDKYDQALHVKVVNTSTHTNISNEAAIWDPSELHFLDPLTNEEVVRELQALAWQDQRMGRSSHFETQF